MTVNFLWMSCSRCLHFPIVQSCSLIFPSTLYISHALLCITCIQHGYHMGITCTPNDFSTYPEGFVVNVLVLLLCNHILFFIISSTLYISHPVAFSRVRCIDAEKTPAFGTSNLRKQKKTYNKTKVRVPHGSWLTVWSCHIWYKVNQNIYTWVYFLRITFLWSPV